MQLHCNGSIATYQTENILSLNWNQIHSPSLSLNIGVPKGSILGHLLFLININDVVNSSNILYSFSLLMPLQYMFKIIQLKVHSSSTV